MVPNHEEVKVGDVEMEHGVKASGAAEFHDRLS